MNMKTLFGIASLVVGVAGGFIGIGAISRDLDAGWIGIGVGVVSNALAYRTLRGAASAEAAAAKGADER